MLSYLFAIIAGGVTFVGLFLFQTFPLWWVLLGIFVFVSAVLFLLFWYAKHRLSWGLQPYILAMTMLVSSIALMSVVDTDWVRRIILWLGSGVIGLLYAWNASQKQGSPFSGKPYRRFITMLMVFEVYAISTFLFALSSFFLSPTFFLLLVFLGACMYGMVSIQIWRLYLGGTIKRFFIWGWIVGIITFEFIWIIYLLPFAYPVLALLVTWIWYMLQLFIRFHLGERGIIWKKQIIFLSINVALYALILAFFVRWV